MVRALLLALLAACVASPPPQPPLGPPGTWSCSQIVENCDDHCATGICLNACTNQGSPEGARLHAMLIQCAAANRCVENTCTRAVCHVEVDACIANGDAPSQMPPQPQPQPQRPPPPQPPRPPPPPSPQPPPQPPAHAPQPPVHAAPQLPAHPPAEHAPTTADVTGEWSYGQKTALGEPDPKTGAPRPGTGAGGVLRLESDGRFERATSVEGTAGKCKTTTFGYATGAWKLDGSTLVLAEKQAFASFRDSCKKAQNYDREDTAKTDRRAVRMTETRELEVTDDAGELQSYRKK